MCTIMTFTPRQFVKGMAGQIEKDFKDNPHGSVIMLADKSGELFEIIRTMQVSTLLDSLDNAKKWSRVFIHQRFATQGSKSVNNVHGWQFGASYWMHNGSLYDPRAARFPVDSQLIGHWLADYGTEGAIKHIAEAEYFANVLVVDNAEKNYWIARGGGGQLHTDGRGNFSTHAIDTISIPVPEGFGHFETRTGNAFVYGFVDPRKSQLPPEQKKEAEPEDAIPVKRVAEMTDEEYAMYMRKQWQKDTENAA